MIVTSYYMCDVHLVIVGEGPEKSALTSLAALLDVAPRVHFTGYLENVGPVFAGLSVFVLASSFEGMSNSLLEAMVSGCPVVVSDVDGSRELVEHGETGLRFQSGSTDAMRKMMVLVLKDQALAKTLAIKAKSFVLEKYSWEKKHIENKTGTKESYKPVKIKKDVSNKKWRRAIETIKSLKRYFPEKTKIEDLINILSQEEDSSIEAVNLININSDGNEFSPVISADNKKLFFCGSEREDNLSSDEDIYLSESINNQWNNEELYSSLSNSGSNDAIMAISTDGNTVIQFIDGKLGISEKKINGWGNIQFLSEKINLGKWNADAMFSSDGSAIIFSSSRSMGFNYSEKEEYHASGNKYQSDIYVSLRDSIGNWMEPINIGPVINTPYSERSPFLHPDMKTLYFSSDGHGGLGKYDVFKTTRLNDDCWTCWSDPINLGKQINTVNDDWGYKISTDGNYAYFSRKPKNKDHTDLYYMNIPFYLRPDFVATISGIIKDHENNPIEANIIWEDLEKQKKIGFSKSDPLTGEFFMVLPMGKNYGWYVNKEGFFPISNNINLTDQEEPLTIEEDLKIITFETMISNEIPVPVNNLFFSVNSSKLLRSSYLELNRIAKIIKENNLKVEIAGHTDNTGKKDYNLMLSKKRALEVEKYLKQRGCNPILLKVIGYGDENPVANNDTEEGKKKNRRVELKFIK